MSVLGSGSKGGMVVVCEDGKTEIVRVDCDECNLEAEEEFVLEGMAVDQLHQHCTVHRTIRIPTPLKEDGALSACLFCLC